MSEWVRGEWSPLSRAVMIEVWFINSKRLSMFQLHRRGVGRLVFKVCGNFSSVLSKE